MFRRANQGPPKFSPSHPWPQPRCKILSFEGVERISTSLTIQLELVSERPDLDIDSLLQQPALLQLRRPRQRASTPESTARPGRCGKRLTRYL